MPIRLRCSFPVSIKTLALLAALALVPSCAGLVDGGGGDGDNGNGENGGGANGGGDENGGENGGPDGPPPDETPWTAAPAPVPVPQAAIDSISTAIRGRLNSISNTHSVRVDNLTTGQTIFASDAEVVRKPASNMKLISSAANLEILGADHRQTIGAFGTAAIDSSGVLNGDLHLIAEDFFLPTARDGDTWEVYPARVFSFYRLGAQLHRAGLRRVTGSVVLSGAVGYYRDTTTYVHVQLPAQRSAAAGPLRTALENSGISVARMTTSASLTPPAGAVPITAFQSNGALLGSTTVNVRSNNEAADLWAYHLGWKVEGDHSYAGGEKAMLDWMGSIGVPTTGLAFKDGSGLSHNNRISANAIISLFAFMEKSPVGALWRRSLTISGIRGTLGGRLTGVDTRGRVFAKTGTLTGVKALSGYFENKYDGHRYAFAGLLNSVSSTATAYTRLTQIVETFSGNLRGNGLRLIPPTMSTARGTGFEGVGHVTWQPVTGAVGYILWTSSDGYAWLREDARAIDGTEAVVHELSAVDKTYVRVTALGSDGMESDPSVVLALTAAAGFSKVLLVDGNSRWRGAPPISNTTVRHHDFLVGLADSVSQLSVDSASAAAVAAGTVDLTGYSAVVWAAGEESTRQDALAPAQQTVLKNYLDGGGAVVLSGAELLYTLSQRDGAADREFAADVMHAAFAADDADTHEFYGEPSSEFSSIALASFRSPDAMAVGFPDILTSVDGDVLLRYQGGEGNGGVAAVGHRDTFGVVTFGFPIEAMQSPGDRAAVLDASFRYLGVTE